MENLFLIGGNGFIGKNLVRYLSPYYKIFVFDKYIDTSFFENYPEVVTLLLDLETEKIPLFSQKSFLPDYIINLASIVTAERDLSLFDGLISSNLRILLNLYERFKDEPHLKLFIQLGSSEEYGSDNSPLVETQREIPVSPYALVKQLTVNTALMLYRNFGFPVMAIRPANVFGPLQSNKKFIPYVIDKLKKGDALDITLCEQKRDMLYVDDFSWLIRELLLNAIKCKGEIVNIGSGESVELKKIVELSKSYLQSKSEIHYGVLSYRPNEVMDLRCSVNKLSKIIGKEIKFDLQKRLINYIDSI